MITEVEYEVTVFGTTTHWTVKHSDFKDGEQPLHTGHKRNYRKAKYSKHGYWIERYERRPRCWKDQRKTKYQYKTIVFA